MSGHVEAGVSHTMIDNMGETFYVVPTTSTSAVTSPPGRRPIQRYQVEPRSVDEPLVGEPAEVARLEKVVGRGVHSHTLHGPTLVRFVNKHLASCNAIVIANGFHNFPALLRTHSSSRVGNRGGPSRDQDAASLPEALRARDQTLATPLPRFSRKGPSLSPDK